MPTVAVADRLHRFRGHPLQRGVAGMVLACSVLLAVSCSSAGQSARADETAASSDASAVILADLDDAGAVAAWTTVNDPVMGGTSTSNIRPGDGGLVFTGTISLANNGGFASARGPQDPVIGRKAAGAKSLHVRAMGDGKTYLLKLGIAGQPWSYIQRFQTEAAVQRSYDLPVAGFEPVGMRLEPEPNAPQTLDPSSIDQLSVYILDKQQGPFEIAISRIEAIA